MAESPKHPHPSVAASSDTSTAKLYSIGYATKPVDVFIQQLQRYQVTAVADIRSVPFSKVFADYHQGAIEKHLHKAGIRYVYLGDELGPRSKDEAHYNADGQVQFDRLMQSDLFAKGIARLHTGLQKGMTIALMCAEKDPATCHRSTLVAYYLARHGVALAHIRHDGELESQTALELRILQENSDGCGHGDLFLSDEERLRMAYEQQLKRTSYIKPLVPMPPSREK